MRKNQNGFAHLLTFLFIIVAIALIVMAGIYVKSRSKNKNSPLNNKEISQLPDISYYQTNKSDQFIVDMSLVKSGFPFKGKNSITPHNGAHAQFGNDNESWPQGGTEPANYPAIYSPVDGYVTEVNNHFSDYSKNPVDLYTIKIAFAKSGKETWSLFYSVEPYVKEPSDGFYAKFIDVKVGQQIKKGQTIAHMYLDKKAGNSEHIHFHLLKSDNSNFYAPAIFSKEIVQAFHDRWAEFGVDDPHNSGKNLIPACMGYKLSADENPFGTGAGDCLN